MIFGYSVTNTLKWIPFTKPTSPFNSTVWRRPNGLNLDNSNNGLLSTYSAGTSTTAPVGTSLGIDNRIFSYPQLASDIFKDDNNITPYIYKDLYFDVQTAGLINGVVNSWDCSYTYDVFTGGWTTCDFGDGCAGNPCGGNGALGEIRGCCNDCYCRCLVSVTCYNRVTVFTFVRYVYVAHSGFTNIATIYSGFSSCNNC